MGLTRGVWGVRWGPKPALSILEPLKIKIWHVLSCVLRPRNLPGFLSDSLQRPRGSRKTDNTWMAQQTPTWKTYIQKHMCTHANSPMFTSVLQLHRVIYYDTCSSFTNITHVAVLPLVICAAVWILRRPTGRCDGALSTWNLCIPLKSTPTGSGQRTHLFLIIWIIGMKKALCLILSYLEMKRTKIPRDFPIEHNIVNEYLYQQHSKWVVSTGRKIWRDFLCSLCPCLHGFN